MGVSGCPMARGIVSHRLKGSAAIHRFHTLSAKAN
jgi:hypothetical protein